MIGAGLSLANAPPLSVPLRYFLTAPLFAILAGALLAFEGDAVLGSRYSPATIAATHLLTLGFITMVMLGALSQMIPVLAGSYIRAPRTTAWIVHPLLTAGTALLAAGLLGMAPLLGAAGLALAIALAVFVVAAAEALLRVPARHPSVAAMRLALAALAITVVLGLLLVAARAGLALPFATAALVHLHPGWGLAGWVGILVAGVAFQVVPMFQITPEYPRRLQHGLAAALFGGLLLASTPGAGVGVAALSAAGALLAAAALVAFALATLHVQRRRRRRVDDTTLACWRLGMFAVLAAVALWVAVRGGLASPRAAVLIGIVVLVGAVQSLIIGMLYKIVPFLVWLHLRPYRVRWFTMSKALPEAAARRQYRAHVVALVLLVAAWVWPALAPAAGLAYVAANVWLGWNLLHCLRVFAQRRAEALRAPPAPVPEH